MSRDPHSPGSAWRSANEGADKAHHGAEEAVSGSRALTLLVVTRIRQSSRSVLLVMVVSLVVAMLANAQIKFSECKFWSDKRLGSNLQRACDGAVPPNNKDG